MPNMLHGKVVHRYICEWYHLSPSTDRQSRDTDGQTGATGVTVGGSSPVTGETAVTDVAVADVVVAAATLSDEDTVESSVNRTVEAQTTVIGRKHSRSHAQ